MALYDQWSLIKTTDVWVKDSAKAEIPVSIKEYTIDKYCNCVIMPYM